jgi:phage/plasmid-like protein (TIGR03299 family)
MAHEIETMAYLGSQGRPWHGLGNTVADGATVDDLLQASGTDWKVGKRFLHVRTNRSDASMMLLKGRYALMRETDGQFYNFVSDDYHPVQNREMYEFFRSYCEAGEMTIDTAGSLKQGAVIWVLARVNHGTDFTLAGGDTVKGYVLLCNSHDGSMVYSAMHTSIRVVCHNTLSMALGAKDRLFRVKHSMGKDNRKVVEADAKKNLDAAMQAQRKLKEVATVLSETKLDTQTRLDYVYQLTTGESLLETAVRTTEVSKGASLLDMALENTDFQRKARKVVRPDDLNRVGKMVLDSILNSPGSQMDSSKGTLWGAVNGVTHYADHVAGRSRDTALQSAWFGDKAGLKQDALELAIQYAGAAQKGA